MRGREVKENVNDAKAAGRGFRFKNRKPAYLAAALIVACLLVIYLLNVYHNKHENKPTPPPKILNNPKPVSYFPDSTCPQTVMPFMTISST